MRADPLSPRTASLLAGALAVLVFLPSLAGGFVYDDFRFYVENARLGEWSVLYEAFTDPSTQTADASYAGIWRPIRTLSFALDRALFGGAAWGPHAVNVLLHGVGAALLARLLMAWRVTPAAAVVGAAVFAFHPVQVECVAWVSSRGDLLAHALVLGSLLLAADGRRRWSLVAGALGLLTKEQAVVWPAFALLSALLCGRDLRTAVRGAIPPLVLTLCFVALRQAIVDEPFQEGGLGLAMTPRTLFLMLGHQTWYAVLPVGGVFDWQLPPPGGRTEVVLAGLACVGALIPRASRVPAAWFLAALVPTLFVQLVIPLNILVADRFLLFALPALALVVARAASRERRVLVPAALGALGLAALTSWSLPAWRTNEALWMHAAERDPTHWRANAHLGMDALRAGDADAAIGPLETAVEVNPQDGQSLFRLGMAYELRAAAMEGGSTEQMSGFREARDAYGASIDRLRTARPEAAVDLPLAQLAFIHMTAFTEADGLAALEAVLSSPAPQVAPERRRAWALRIRQIADGLDGAGDPGLAQRVRDWGATP